MTLARMVGGAFLLVAVAAGTAVVWRLGSGTIWANGSAHDSGSRLHGFVEAPGLELLAFRVRLAPLRWEKEPQVRYANLDARGGFAFEGVEDTDHRLELVWRHDRELVLAQADFARPGLDELVLAVDPVRMEEWLAEVSARPVAASDQDEE